MKLKYYRIDSQVINWIAKWLTSRKQCVLLDGESSDYVPVTSGVPQGTVLGPLLFLIYINDIIENITSKLRLFADDCLLYRVITSEQDTVALQKDLDILAQWASKWQMKFNISKCTFMRCTRSLNPICLFDLGPSLNGVRMCGMGPSLFVTYINIGEDTKKSCQMGCI